MTACDKRTGALLLSPSHGFGGGIERVVDALVEAWPGVITRVDLYAARRERRAEGNTLAKLRFTMRAVTTARASRPDQIICLHMGLLPVAHAAAIVVRKPVTLVAYGTEVWAPMTKVEQRLVRRCSRLIAISNFTAQWLAKRARVARSRVEVLPLSIASQLARRATRPAAPPRPEGTVLTVGRIMRDHRYKGHHDIAAAWPIVLERRPDARWIVIGDGDDVGALREHCRRLGIDHTVSLRQRVGDDELASAYRMANALVLPSRTDVHALPPVGEGFGLVYAEAAAFGVPSIAAVQAGGAAEIVANGKTGLTVNPANALELADAILSLLNDGELRARLGAEARRRVFERHLPEHFAARVRELAA